MDKKTTKTTTKPSDMWSFSEENKALLESCITLNQPSLLIGETGVGKTTLIRELAKKHGKNLVRISVNGSMGVEEILGKWLVKDGSTYWHDGILTSALRNGDWVVMDEINAALPEILFTLHSLLDDDRKIIIPEKDNETVIPHDEFRFFATMNPPEEYSGTKDMNKALMSRFTAVLNVDTLSEVEEAKLLVEFGASDIDATNLVRLASKLREQKKKNKIFYYCSTRDLVHAVNLMSTGLSFENATEGSIKNKMTEDEFKELSGVSFGLKEKIPFKSIDEMFEMHGKYAKLDKELKEEKEAHKKAKNEVEVMKKKVAESFDVSRDKFLDEIKKLTS